LTRNASQKVTDKAGRAPVRLFLDILDHRIGDPTNHIGRDLDPVTFLRMGLDLASRQTGGIEADDPVSKPSRRVCPLSGQGQAFGDNRRGSKLLLRSRGTAISIAPSSPITVLFE
jgi:hypothetical protein